MLRQIGPTEILILLFLLGFGVIAFVSVVLAVRRVLRLADRRAQQGSHRHRA